MRKSASFLTVASSVLAILFLCPTASYAVVHHTTVRHDFAVCAGCHSIPPGVAKRGRPLTRSVRRKSRPSVEDSNSIARATANIPSDDVSLQRYLSELLGFVPDTKTPISAPSGADPQNLTPHADIFHWCLKPALCPSDSEYRGVP
jgi:cytochrome c2